MKWIKVEDRLPKNDNMVLVFMRDVVSPSMVIVRYMPERKKWDSYGFNHPYGIASLITHWMPLPEEPNEG